MSRLIFILFFLYTQQAIAQLQANFVMDTASGCSPLEVFFTNTTTGASPAVTYKWDFGNGNTSTLKDPGATYKVEKTYLVTLTATDGGKSSTVSKTITVYKQPTVSFSASSVRGCVPMNVTFTAKVTAGDGKIANYLWDFGDGRTLEGDSLDKVAHTYTVPQQAPVSLTVTNNYGCYTSLSKNALIEVLPKLIASFTASKNLLCAPGQVSFTNNSTGGGIISYLWDFGDGQFSTEVAPTHDYVAKGTYIVRLSAKNDAGCTATASTQSINVANYKADFALPVATCTNQLLGFVNKSTRPYDSLRWQVDNLTVGYTQSTGNMNYRTVDTGIYNIKLVSFYKECSDSIVKTIKVSMPPQVKGFLVDRADACNLPARYTFTDTSIDGTKWLWKDGSGVVFDSGKSAVRNYAIAGSDKIGLAVINAEGCTTNLQKTINFYQTDIDIIIKTSTSPGPSSNRGCPGLKVTFSTTPLNEVVSFAWNLGDGTLSNKPEPTYTYNKYGSYQVSLDFVTKTGCQGRVTFDSIFITDIQPSDFNVSPDTLICGNSKVVFTPSISLPNRDYIWLINGKEALYSLTPAPFEHHFQEAGVYTISLVIKAGSCRDTVTKVNYVTVLPPFPQIKSAINTCNGTRGLVMINDTTRSSTSWAWDFGDGSSLNYGSFIPALSHNYSKTGNYKLKLTATNGPCTVSDSLYVPVLLKQNPKLSSPGVLVCSNDSAIITLSNFELHPKPDTSLPYLITKLQFGDLTSSNAVVNPGNWTTKFTAAINGLERGKQDLRIITTSAHFGCEDTSNFINMKVTGPLADFSFNKFTCFNTPLVTTDLSTATPGSPIVKWDWFFGDSTSYSAPNNKAVPHQYAKPGTYQLGLKVTDVNGCSSETPADSSYLISLTGPAADFEASAYNIFINNRVDFYNKSTYFDSNSELKWKFPDGSVSTDNDTYFYFDTDGDYTVRLSTKNLLSGCSDTVKKVIHVKRVQSVFSYELTYTNSSNCPPVLVALQSQSVNAARVSWSFGDGGIAGNQTSVTHVYTSAGIYQVVHYSYDSTGRVDSSTQLIEVKGPSAILSADTLFACNTLKVQLTAKSISAVSFKWDFGDGTITATTDTFASHLYKTPGIYAPALILTDSAGCSAPSQLAQKIIIDSLGVTAGVSPTGVFCDSAMLSFTSTVKSLSQTRLGTPVSYLWTSDLHPNDSIKTKSASWNFNKVGLHKVHLLVTSPYGCRIDVFKQADIKQGLTAAIKGEAVACKGDSIQFYGFASPDTGSLAWNWKLANNNFSNRQNPDPVVYPAVGVQQITLVVNNGYCYDTANYLLKVFAPPVVRLTASKPYVCLGDTAVITASGGNSILWSPLVYSLQNAGYTAIIKPDVPGFYKATISDTLGCTASDSLMMDVKMPIKVTAPPTLLTCFGTGIQLTATGASSYKWSGKGFSSTAGNPFIVPIETGIYTVVGYDGFNCFTDTSELLLTVRKLPTVDAGPDLKVIAGFDTRLAPVCSPDVVKWTWQPSRFLSCADCAVTVSKPQSNMDYIVTVANDAGCIARDTVRLEILCGSDLVHIPTAFTPNSDNLNDRFTVHGSGITIKRLAIFDRWGKVIFERRNIDPFDRNSSWDGTYNGIQLPGGGYVYMVEAICEKGEAFTFKGVVTLIR